jgi:lipid-A-disaccharide synthase
VRYFFSTGEASGESSALLLAQAIRTFDPQAQFEGIGAERMRAAGFRVWRDNTGWASMGPLAAIPRIPKLLATMLLTARHINKTKPDLVVLVDFGVFNLRLARQLRRLGYTGPILDLFPPGTWLDNENKARMVSAATMPVTAFEHQYRFYQSIGCPIEFFGHPLAGEYEMRPPQPPPAKDAGIVAILPGSRSGELRRHLPVLAAAYRLLQQRRPQVRGVFGAANERSAAAIAATIERERLTDVEVVAGAGAALARANAVWVSSGTAVLEAALLGVPAVAIYIISPMLVKHGRTLVRHRFITLPNLVLGREVVPEVLQERATPERLADEMERLLTDSTEQYAQFAQLRDALGPRDALERCARYAVDLARG